MPNIERVTNYIDQFLYTVSRPGIAEILLSSVDMEKLKKADAGTKLMSLGALFTSGEFDRCVQLADQLDFHDILPEESSLLVLIIFNKFYDHGLVSQPLANVLKHLLVAICPDALLAHKQPKESFSQNSLVKLDYASSVYSSVSGAIVFSEFTFAPGSRKCEAGYRIKNALESYGWDISLFILGDVQHYSTSSIKDFVMIDALAFSTVAIDHIRIILSRLKRYFRKIIMLETDVWAGRSDNMLRSISDQIDYIWGFTTEWRLTGEPDFKERSILFPYFGGFDHLDSIIDAPLDRNTCTFNFTGSIQNYNLNRINWLLEFIHHNLPVEIKITKPEVDDGLDPVYSQYLYAQAIAATHAAINLTTRRDGSRPATGRSFEVVSLNRLLIQESCPVFNSFFVEGEHYLEFSSLEELSIIIEFLRSHPKTVRNISMQGYQFYKERYSCKKLVEHIQTLL